MSGLSHTLDLDLGERSYSIHIGPGLLAQADRYMPFDLAGRRIFILADEAVAAHRPRLEQALQGKAAGVETLEIKAGEQAKSWRNIQQVADWLLGLRADRQSVFIALGGGVIGDLGGFAASIVLRGLPYIQIPTTLLSMVDSSVGGKTGINTASGKNLVGSFYQPRAVLADTDVLKTLPRRELLAGYAECVKHAAIFDADFFAWLESHAAAILALDPGVIADNIARNCRIKADVVQKDEREAGLRALLNLGHTFGHALEAAAGYDGRLLHGEAVSVGMVLAHRLSVKMGLCPPEDAARLEKHLAECGMKTEVRDIVPALAQSAEAVAELMKGDKKVAKGRLSFILTRGIGKAFVTADVDMKDVVTVIAESM